MDDVNREVNTTRTWGIAILGAVLIPAVGGFIWVGGIDNRVQRNEEDIVDIKNEVSDFDDTLTEILIGIQEIKGDVKQLKGY